MILLVEDDEDVREMLVFTLATRGYVVEAVANGLAALEFIDRQRPCLVILDLVMPVMNGHEVLAQLKARQLSAIPVCVVSALAGPVPEDAVMSLTKPFEVPTLLAIAARYCAHVALATRG